MPVGLASETGPDAQPAGPARVPSARPSIDLRRRWQDAVAATLLAVLAAWLALDGSSRVSERALSGFTYDIYFQSDMQRVYAQMESRWTTGVRTRFHPLFPVVGNAPVLVMRHAFSLTTFQAVRATLALVAVAWVVLLYALLRVVGIRVGDASIFSVAGLFGAGAVFWLPIPETFSFGAVTILLACLVAAIADRRPLSDFWYVAAGVATFAMTISNWLVGALLAATRRPWSRVLQIGLNVLAVTTILWFMQARVYHNSEMFLENMVEPVYWHAPSPVRAVEVSRAFFVHAAVAPQIELCWTNMKNYPPFLLSVQGSGLASRGPVSVVATVAWFVLLAAGCYALSRVRGRRTIRFLICGGIAAQLAMHSALGGETFVYGLHWWTLLVPLVAMAALTRLRRVALAAAIVFAATAATVNIPLQREAITALRSEQLPFAEAGRPCVY